MKKIIGIQGDIVVTRVDSIPEKAKKREGKVLVYGESTGHLHQIKDGEVYEIGNRLFFNTSFPTEIIHDEHNPIPVEKGSYEILRQREYTNKDAVRLVVD